MRSAEQNEILGTFLDMLAGPTGDGGNKRAAGTKPHWKVDGGHTAALYSHLKAWQQGADTDADSGCHPLVHLAWRALAIAWQDNERAGRHPSNPEPDKFRLAKEMAEAVKRTEFIESLPQQKHVLEGFMIDTGKMAPKIMPKIMPTELCCDRESIWDVCD